MPPNSYFYSSTAGAYTLTGSISNSATTLSVSSVTGLPGTMPFKVVLDPGQVAEEIVKVTAVAGTTLTVTRGWDGTTASAHSAGATVRHMMTAEDLTLSRTHEAATSGVHGTTGAVVGVSDAQTLTNKNLTSGTNTFPSSLATTTGVQVITNKDLSSATNTFPAALATLTGVQTLTNKTINTPAITGQATAERLFITNNIGTTFVPLIVQGMVGQTASLQLWRDETGATVASVDKSGNFTTNDVQVGDPTSSTQRKLKLRKKSSTTTAQGEVQVYVVDNAGENRGGFVLLSDGVEQARWELTPTGDFQVKVGGVNVFTTADSGWVNVTVNSGFAGQGGTPPQVRKIGNRVYYRWGFANTGIAANAETTNVGTIPSGYRPARVTYINAVGSTGNQYSMLVINPSGAISVRSSTGLPDYFLAPGELNGWFLD